MVPDREGGPAALLAVGCRLFFGGMAPGEEGAEAGASRPGLHREIALRLLGVPRYYLLGCGMWVEGLVCFVARVRRGNRRYV